MSELATYIQFGFRHIMDVEAMDHILFLVALAAIYRFRDAKSALWVVTAFTVGHSLTLALAVTHTVSLPTRVIEFLIPVTIVLTGLANVIASRPVIRSAAKDLYFRPLLAGLFGLIHGAGFANYLQALFVDRIAAPLIGFNVGIELGQVVVLLAAATIFSGIDATITAMRITSDRWPALRLRAVAVSMLVVTVCSAWAVERSPW